VSADASIDHHNTFSNSSSQVERTILFADLTGSTEMKHRMGYLAWLPILGSFLDITTEAVTGHGGTIVKYLGDGALAVFEEDHAHQAICAAIEIQESLRNNDRRAALGETRATIGIATGKVIEYPAPGGGGAMDYVGSAVDLAARFSSDASPSAIWIDTDTYGAANHHKVSSIIGRANHRKAADYFSREEQAPAKGFPSGVPYREVVWDQNPFGVKGAAVTETIRKMEAARPPSPRPQPPAPQSEPLEGTVNRWFGDSTKGFISTVGHGDYYVDARFVVGGQSLTEGAAVRFVPQPPVTPDPDAKPVAGCTVQEGHRFRGTFNNVLASGFGFADVRDQRGNQQSLFVYLGGNAAGHRIGDVVHLEAVRNRKGLSARVVDAPADEHPDEGAVDGRHP